MLMVFLHTKNKGTHVRAEMNPLDFIFFWLDKTNFHHFLSTIRILTIAFFTIGKILIFNGFYDSMKNELRREKKTDAKWMGSLKFKIKFSRWRF